VSAQNPHPSALLMTRQNHTPAALGTQVFTLGAGAKITATAGGAAVAGTFAGHSPPRSSLPAPAQSPPVSSASYISTLIACPAAVVRRLSSVGPERERSPGRSF